MTLPLSERIIFEFQICADVLESVSFWRLAQIFKTQAYISHNASKQHVFLFVCKTGRISLLKLIVITKT